MGYTIPDQETMIDLAFAFGFDKEMYIVLLNNYYTNNRVEKLKKILL